MKGIILTSVWKKGLIIGIIILLVEASIASNLSHNVHAVDVTIPITHFDIQFEQLNDISINCIQHINQIRSLQDILSGNTEITYSPSGVLPLLVILITFSDLKENSTHDRTYFNNLLWGPKPSVSTFYTENSYGKFTYGPGKILGWYQSNITYEWVKEREEVNSDIFLKKAITIADKDFDFNSYDKNKDGNVTDDELTVVVVSPTNYENEFTHVLISNTPITTNDSVNLKGGFTLMGEWDRPGTYAHELGHVLGLPDLYDTGQESRGVGFYDLMGSGNYCGPSHMTAWSKMQLGWLTPTIITKNGTYTIHDIETYSEAYILCDPSHSISEYFLIENRWKGTSYDSLTYEWQLPFGTRKVYDYPDEGILICHIDDKKAGPWFDMGSNSVNSREEHKGVDIECSDKPSSHFLDADDLDAYINRGDEKDLWDSSTYDFDDFSSPCNATWYDSTPSGLAIRNFSVIGPTMTMSISLNSTIENHPPTNLSITGAESGKAGTPYEYSFVAMDPEKQYINYYIDWGDGTSTEWTIPKKSGLPQKIVHFWVEKGTYLVRLKARDNFGAESNWTTLTVTMPYTIKPPLQQFFDWFFQRFPDMFPLLRQLRGY